MIMSEMDEKEFNETNTCHICKEEIISGKVRDHCRITGKYRGPAQLKCNLDFKLCHKIPVVFHNLRGYDGHLIMQEIRKFGKNINVIPNNSERYIAFMISNLKFIDSIQFLNQSLSNLACNLEDHPFTRSYFGEDYELMKRKAVYPYDYMDSFERFKEEKLPSKECFYSKLNDEVIGEGEYNHALKVWGKCKILGDYHDL